MAVDPDHLDAVAGTVATIYREAETALVRALQKWLAGALDSQLQGPEWLNAQLAQITTLRKAAEAVQAAVKQVADPEIKAALASAYKAGSSAATSTILSHLDPGHPLAEAARQAQEEIPQFGAVEALANALISDIGAKSANVLRDVEDIYRAVITAGAARTVTGAQTRRQASQAAFAGLLKRGITSFTDVSGRKWRLASYVEMAVRTVTQRAAIQGEEDRLRALGVRLVTVSNAPEECERCEPFEGRILALDGPTGQIMVPHQLTGKLGKVTVTATLAEARLAGLFHPNCRHSISAYLPGVSTVPRPTADPVGREARTKQRALERKIRTEKLQVIGALTPEAKASAKRKVARAQLALREHLAAHPDLKRLRYREQIGAGNMPPAGHNDPASAIWPPEPEPEPGPEPGPDQPTPAPEPEPEPEPVPEPGEQTLAALLDPNDPITAADLLDALTVHTAQPEGALLLDLDEAAAALSRFVALADEGESGTWAKAHVKFVAKLQATSDDDLGKYVRRRLGQLRTDAQRAATMREWWRELARRAERPRTPGMRQGQRYRENAPAVKWAMAEMPQPELSEYQRVALQAYTGSGYSFINNGLRGWQMPSGPVEQLRFDRYIEHIDAIFAKTSLDEAIIVHRGTGGSVAKALGADIADPRSMQALVGQVHVEPGYISTSIGARAAFEGQIYWMFRLPQGYQALNAMHTSVFGQKEREILIRRNARYVIHAVYQRGPSWHVEAEMVPDDWDRPPDWTPDGYHDAWEGYE